MKRPIPHLVFSTRSPNPKSGPDFVREVVAESPGVSDEVRSEFARRADIAGSILQHELQHAVYMFCPVAANVWLLCRAVSLGLYRKGSNQLLVHGVVLAEEHLEALEGNPLLLNVPEVQEGSGLVFRAEHPGSERHLPQLSFDGRVTDLCHRLNQQRLERLAEWREDWLAAAYDALAEGRRVGFTMPSPEPDLLEALLLHFHLDDRLELSFHTFYSHSRAVDYRLLAIASEDAQVVRGQFRDLRLLDLAERPQVSEKSLGRLAVPLRKRSAEGFLARLEEYRLTHWSRRFMRPLKDEEPWLVLRAEQKDSMTPAERELLQYLALHRQRGLHARVATLVRTWRDDPEHFAQQLGEVANTEEKITIPKLSEVLATPPVALENRWCLLALLTCPEGLLPGMDWRMERRKAWRALVRPEDLPKFLDALNPVQAAASEAILLEYVLESVHPAAGNPPRPPYWETFYTWLLRRGRLESKVLVHLENRLAELEGSMAQDAWPRLQILAYQAGLAGEALRLYFSRILPALARSDAAEKTEAAIRWWLAKGAEHDSAVAPLLGRLEVAEDALPILADWLVEKLAGEDDQPYRRMVGILEGIKNLSVDAGPACGHFLARLALTRLGDRVPTVLNKCLAAVSDQDEARGEEFVGGALAAAAADLIPVLEGPCRVRDLSRYVQAAASLLEARNGRPATAAADAELLHLAVWSRILAEKVGTLQLEPAKEARMRKPEPAREAVKSLDVRWVAFLGDRNLRVLELLAGGAGSSNEIVRRVEYWLDRLHGEIAAEPPRYAEEDPRFKLFIRLAWWRWVVAGDSSGWWAVCAKLRVAQAWGRFQASTRWLRQQMEELVPKHLWDKALPLLPPGPSLLGKLEEKLLGGRR